LQELTASRISMKRSDGNELMNHRTAALALILFAVLAIAGCVGTVKSVDLVLATPPCGDGFCGARMNQTVKYRVSGLDQCKVVRFKFGDGLSIDGNNIDFGSSGATQWEVDHIYTGWPGNKTVTVEGVTNCTGTATQRVAVVRATGNPAVPFRNSVSIGFGAGPTTCSPVPNVPPLRRGTEVKVTTAAPTVNFGCPFNGCIFDADGKPNSTAGGTFPFLGLREFSLVLRIGTQVAQGGNNTSFTANQSGPLELCMNDDNLADNTGGWTVNVTADESAAP
jgi:hypothetical protein